MVNVSKLNSVDPDFAARFQGAGLVTAEVLYHMPDYPDLLQTFVWQTMDKAPKYPRLMQFLYFWRSEIEALIHSVRVAHADSVTPVDMRLVDGEFRLN